jgi:adenine deaminase
MLREGSLRQDLEPTLKPLIANHVNLERLILVTDSMSPDDVQKLGHMDHVLRRAISLGLSGVQAIQAVTLHPAVYSGLDQEIGGIAPGRFADIVLLSDLAQVSVKTVMVGGKIAARDGEPLVRHDPIALPPDMMNSLHRCPAVNNNSFKIASPQVAQKVRVIELINPTITAEQIVVMKPSGNYLEADAAQDLLKVAMFDRHGESGKVALGFLRGFGARVGAAGLTTNLDENTLMVVGSNEDDMALCANALIDCGGGMAIVERGTIEEKLEFSFGGIFSLDPWQEVGKGLSRIQRYLRDKGSPFDKPVFTLSFLPFVTLPSLRITSRGLVSVKERKIVSLFVADGVKRRLPS